MSEQRFTEENRRDWEARKEATRRVLASVSKGHLETFVEGIGDVRECVDCGCLLAGGPTRCIRCVKEGPPKSPVMVRLRRRLVRILLGCFYTVL